MLRNRMRLQKAKKILKVDQKNLSKRRKEFGEGHVMVALNEAIVALDELRIATIERGKSSEEYMQAKVKYEKQRDRLQAKRALLNGLRAAIIKDAVKTLDEGVVEEKLI